MRLTSAPPLAVGSFLWRSRPDSYVLTILSKATFALKPGQAATITAPEPPSMADRPWHRETQSIGIPTDLVPIKRNVDVLLIGHAYAPQRIAVPSLTVGLSFGTINKSVLVTGDRSWLPDGTCPDPDPFVRMPLCWDRAAGGPSTWNPLGIPVGARIDPQMRPRIPNLLPRGFVVQNSTHLIPTVGFGAIAPHWPGRANYVRKWASSWDHSKWSESVLPQDLDTAYFNAAPADQQLRELPQTTPITLDHVHPDLPRFVSFVEDLRPRALVVRSPGAAPQELWLRADTVVIDVDRATCSITWRASIPLRHPQEDGMVHIEPTRGTALAGPPVTTNAIPPIQTAPSSSGPPAASPMAKTDVISTVRLSASERIRHGDSRMSMKVDEFTTMPLLPEQQAQPSHLPFRPPSPSSPPGALPFAPQAPAPQPERPSASNVRGFGSPAGSVMPNAASMPVDEGTTLEGRAKPVDGSTLPFRPTVASSPGSVPPPAPPTPHLPQRERLAMSMLIDDDTTLDGRAKPKTDGSNQPFHASGPKAMNPRAGDDEITAIHSQPAPKREASDVDASALSTTPANVHPDKTSRPDAPPERDSALPFRRAARAPEDATNTRDRLAATGASAVLPFQTPPSAGEPPPARERLPSVPPSAPMTVAAPPPSVTPNSPAPPAVNVTGLPFQPATHAPVAPRERLPSVPSIGLPFGTPLGGPSAPPIPNAHASTSGLPFQTPASGDSTPPPPRERLSSIPEPLPFSAPRSDAPSKGLSSSLPGDAPRPVQWGRLSGNESAAPLAVKPTEAAPSPKPTAERSFERYARIKAHLWALDGSRDEVLGKYGLDEIEWRILEQQQAEALEVEAKEGRCDLALALVAALEAAQGPMLAAP